MRRAVAAVAVFVIVGFGYAVVSLNRTLTRALRLPEDTE